VTEWLPVPGYTGYEVSDDGQVRSFKRYPSGMLLTQFPVKGGYFRVNLSQNGQVTKLGVHQIVMLAFEGPPPDGFEVCHGNGHPAINQRSNLSYGTSSKNARDRTTHGRGNAGKDRCPAGHLYDKENTRWVTTPCGLGRQCRKCDQERQQARRAANRETYNAAARERRRKK
jgi:hypothetical protein